jgi:hypothetical protein
VVSPSYHHDHGTSVSEVRMATEFGKRRAEIMTFLKGLSPREKLVVLSCLSNDAMICACVPNLARTVLDMHRSYFKLELLQLADTECPSLNLEFLARRKGCRLERAGQGDRWRILQAENRGGRSGIEDFSLKSNIFTRDQALEVLRSLPDQASSVRSSVPIKG